MEVVLVDSLLRSNIGDPSIPLSTRTPVKIYRTSAVFSQLAALGAAGTEVYQKEHEVNTKRQAMNDVVNHTINPDLNKHEAAYAGIVAKGTALQEYNQLNQDVLNGKYSETDPKDFQELLTKMHRAYKDKEAKNKFSSYTTAQYDNFWLQNEPTLAAGQAGFFRKTLQHKQGQALLVHAKAILDAGGGSKELIDAFAKNNYSLLKSDDLREAALYAGIAKGDKAVLQELDKKFHYNTDPAFSKTYNSAIAGIDKLQRVKNKVNRVEMYNQMKGLANKHMLTLDFYKKYILNNPELRSIDGKDLVTEKQFVNMMWKGNNTFDKTEHQKLVTQQVATGTASPSTSTADRKKAFSQIMQADEQNNISVEDEAVKMGAIAKSSPSVPIPYYKNLIQIWSNTDALNKDGTVNPQWEKDLNTIRIFKDASGDKVFYNYTDSKTSSLFRIADQAMKYSNNSDTTELRLLQAAQAVDKAKSVEESGQKLSIPLNDTDVKDAVDNVLDPMYGHFRFFKYLGTDHYDAGIRNILKQQAISLLDNGLATKDNLEDALIPYAKNRFTVIKDNLQDTQGKDPVQLFGGTPDEVIDDYIKSTNLYEGDKRVLLDVQNDRLRLINTEHPEESDTIIPLSVLRRFSLGKSLKSQYNGKDISNADVLNKYKLYQDSLKKDLTPKTQQIGPLVGTNAVQSEVQKTVERNQQNKLKSFLHLQDDLNKKFFVDYLMNKNITFDYDVNKTTAKEWGTMTPEEKTRTRLNTVDQWESGNQTVQEFMNNTQGIKTNDNTVNTDVLNSFEGGIKTTGYTPTDKSGKVLGHSGVTIGAGVDLGSKSIKDFKGKISNSLLNKIKPYLGLHGSSAKKVANKLHLSKEEAKEITNVIQDKNLKRLIYSFNKDSNNTFSSLPKPWRTVTASINNQYGLSGLKEMNFWKQITSGNFDDAYNNLRNFGDKYPTRRNKEADLIKRR